MSEIAQSMGTLEVRKNFLNINVCHKFCLFKIFIFQGYSSARRGLHHRLFLQQHPERVV
jgi:hypothetical protein